MPSINETFTLSSSTGKFIETKPEYNSWLAERKLIANALFILDEYAKKEWKLSDNELKTL